MVRALEEVPGVKQAQVSFPEKKAMIELDDERVTIERLCEALREKGFVGSSRNREP